MPAEQKLLNRTATDDVLLDDPLEYVGRAGVVPGPLGIDNHNGALLTNLQTIGLGPVNAAGPGQAQLLEACFQKIPRVESLLLAARPRAGFFLSVERLLL